MCWCVDKKISYKSKWKHISNCTCHGQILLRLLYKKLKEKESKNTLHDIEYIYPSKKINVIIKYNFLTDNEETELFHELLTNQFSHMKLYNKDGRPTKVRHSLIFGEIEFRMGESI